MIELKKVSKVYHVSSGKKTVNVLNDITLSIEAGKIYGLVGHNGAGKTTLLKCITTLAKPTSGTIVVNGNDTITAPKDVRKDVSFLSAAVNVDPYFSARYLFRMFGKLYGLNNDTISLRMQELFDYFEINRFEDRKIGELSTGMKQRIMLALSLLNDAKVYIFDEPTNGLDMLTARKVILYLAGLKERGKTVIISSHIMSEIEKTCDEIIMLAFGRVVSFGAPASIFDKSATRSLEDAYLLYYESNAREVWDET